MSAICGPNDDIEIPRGATGVDWEVELGIVIGKEAKYVSEANALDHVAGYCVVNDLSEREFQMCRQGQWTKGKSHDTFGPIGPWLVTADEAEDIEDRGIWLSVNGAPRQHSSTGRMAFKPAFLISYVSQFMTLKPGDILATGTPAGVGMGMNPPQYLQEGDVVTLGVEGLGEAAPALQARAIAPSFASIGADSSSAQASRDRKMNKYRTYKAPKTLTIAHDHSIEGCIGTFRNAEYSNT